MPYNGQGTFSLLPGTYGSPGTTIKSDPYNAQVDDFTNGLNTLRPPSAGGTGASSAEQALINLGGIRTSDVDALFVGMVSPWPMLVPPNGWLICNGAVVFRTLYSALFAAIGTAWGAGDGSTTFGIPDLRGMFFRGLDLGRGIDPGRVLGSTQQDDVAPHTHTGSTTSAGSHQHSAPIETNFTAGSDMAAGAGYSQGTGNVPTSANGAHTHNLTIDPSSGAESRPRNIALNFCIKY